jgi:hypothetical protein
MCAFQRQVRHFGGGFRDAGLFELARILFGFAAYCAFSAFERVLKKLLLSDRGTEPSCWTVVSVFWSWVNSFREGQGV